jgi:ribosomal protein S18 acetylase RimI-like enzyme
MTEAAYRDATPDDAEALSALMRETFCHTFAHLYRPEDLNAFLSASYVPEKQYAEIIDPDIETRLACRNGALAGYCQIGPMSLPYETGATRVLELYRLYVREEVKGQGVAAALMEWALARMRARHAVDAYLGVWCDNARAQKFYARYGFERVGAYKFPVGEALDDEFILRAPLAV